MHIAEGVSIWCCFGRNYNKAFAIVGLNESVVVIFIYPCLWFPGLKKVRHGRRAGSGWHHSQQGWRSAEGGELMNSWWSLGASCSKGSCFITYSLVLLLGMGVMAWLSYNVVLWWDILVKSYSLESLWFSIYACSMYYLEKFHS